MNQHVFALDLFHVWVRLALYISFEFLIVLGDAVITTTSKQPALAKDRGVAAIYQDLVKFVEQFTRFRGRPSCARASPLISSGASSPKESEEQLSLVAYGISQPVANYVVPDAVFASGAPITLDLVWPEFRVAVEYDGNHHRTSKIQWRRGRGKRGMLVGRRQLVFIATAANIANEDTRAEFAFNVARALTLRGVVLEFHVAAMPLEELAQSLP